MWPRPVCFTNAQIVAETGMASSLRFAGRVLSLNTAPRPRDFVLDLGGAFVFPGLINAHDHLELNHFGRVTFREQYQNAAEWIEDMRPRLRSDPGLRRGQAYPLSDRLFVGGLKNLLCGATTVAHHNPLYRELRGPFPVRVVQHYGWAHSFHLQGQSAGARGESAGDIARRYRATPPGYPFMLHLAEGVDDAAQRELERLEALGCLSQNTVLVHGVGLDLEGWRRVARRGVGLVWCPASNLFLLGRSAAIRQFLDACPESSTRIALGTDSRLTGERDLVAEMRVAAATGPASPLELFRMVTVNAANLLRLPEVGRIAPGLRADLLVLPRLSDNPYQALLAAERKDVLLVVIGGRPVLGAPDWREVFSARGVKVSSIQVDGAVKLFEQSLGRQLQNCSLAEPGVEIVPPGEISSARFAVRGEASAAPRGCCAKDGGASDGVI